MNVVVGTPVFRQGAYVIDKFMSNQQEIQRAYPSCELILATNEVDLADELDHLLRRWELRGQVIAYETMKPDYARTRVWNIACGREAIRQYVLSQTEAQYYMSMDADMVYDPAVIAIMEAEIQGCDVVFSGYPLRNWGTGLTGAGCMMVNRATLEKMTFRCVEFKNGERMSEDSMVEMDVFRLGRRIKKGFFLNITHYVSETEAEHVAPQPVGTYRRIATSAPVRYGLIRSSLMTRRNVPLILYGARARIGGSAANLIRRRQSSDIKDCREADAVETGPAEHPHEEGQPQDLR